jgi:hypothetical protein
MHVTAVLDGIKKRGHFYNYEKAAKDHKESTKAVESARAALSLLDGPGVKAKKSCKKQGSQEGCHCEGPRLRVRCHIRSRKQDDFDEASNIVLPCPGS